MFDPAELHELRARIQAQVQSDRHLLDALIEDVRALKGGVQRIYPRTATAVAFVASDGGNNRLVFDPFYAQLVRVTDSYGKPWFVDVVSPTTDTGALSHRQFSEDGTPRTPLGRMMRDLGVETLSELCPFIPVTGRASADRRAAGPTWVLTYRDLCEWAVLYDRICYSHFSTHTLLVRDGLLRNTLFRGSLFSRWQQNVEAAIERIRQEDHLRISLVGMAKRSKMLDRYALAIATEELFAPGQARYVRVPPEIAAKTYRGIAGSPGEAAEDPSPSASRFGAGDLYFVRFGPHSGDPLWPVELLASQADRAAEIFGLLLADARGGFPVPFYPLCLQRAHEHAQVVDFDLRILQDAIFDAVRQLLPEEKQGSMDALQLKTDAAALRYD
jgi:hypothetical protein